MIGLTITKIGFFLYLKLHVKNKVKHFEQINCKMIVYIKRIHRFISYFISSTKLNIYISRERKKSQRQSVENSRNTIHQHSQILLQQIQTISMKK